LVYLDYACALQLTGPIHGRLYITQHHICFFSNLFGFEKKVCDRSSETQTLHTLTRRTQLVIPFKGVKQISRKNTLKLFSNSLRVETAETRYEFTNFWVRYRYATQPC
jgi:hypothetical protein